jgi:hypothetical protein
MRYQPMMASSTPVCLLMHSVGLEHCAHLINGLPQDVGETFSWLIVHGGTHVDALWERLIALQWGDSFRGR